MKINIKNYYNLYLLIAFSFLLRIIAIHYYGDKSIDHEWGSLLNNLYNNGVLSLQFELNPYVIYEGNKLIPSVFMPPLYVFFLYLLKLLTPTNIELVKVVLITQAILSTITIFIFYKLSNFFFSKNWSIINSLSLSVFPLAIYTATQISSVTLQFFLLILYLYLFFLVCRSQKFGQLKIFCLSLVSGLLMLLRGEFYLIFIISVVYLFVLKKLSLQKTTTIFLISLLVISPYLVRNYFTFNKITITKSVGYNLWKGNNPYTTVEGTHTSNWRAVTAYSHDNLFQEIADLPKDHLYEFHYNELFFQKALGHIKKEPVLFVKRYIKKFLSFFYFNINSEYHNYYSPLFIIPLVFVSLCSSIGIIISIKDFNFEKGYLLLYLLSTICIFSIFFILPRYKMAILPVQLIFMNYFFLECSKKFGFFK